MSELMDMELTDFLGRKRYERIDGRCNHRNGSYARKYTLKGIGEVAVREVDEEYLTKIELVKTFNLWPLDEIC